MVADAEPVLLDMMSNGVINGDPAKHAYIISSEMFAVPDEPRFTKSVISFMRNAVDFLYTNVRRLDGSYAAIKWTPVAAGEDYSEGFDTRGFVGKGFYEVMYLSVADRERAEKGDLSTNKHVATSPSFSYGSLDRMVNLQGGSDKRAWFLFVPTNDNAIYAPFAHVMALSTHTVTKKYAENVGAANARLAGRTVSVALSASMAREAIKRYDVPYDERLVGLKLASLAVNPDDRLVVAADEWVKSHGVQAAYDMYMESPERFMRAISAD